MNFFGIGGFEFLLIGAIALFVLGPKRLMEGIREGRKLYTDLKRQRDALQTMLTDAIEMDELKKDLDAEGIKRDVQKLKDDLTLDQTEKELDPPANAAEATATAQKWTPKRPPVIVDSEIRDSVPDLDLGMGDEKLAKTVDAENESAPEASEPGGADEGPDKAVDS